MQVIWSGPELGVTWQEAQIKAEMAERRRKIWEGTAVAKGHLGPSGADCDGCLCKVAEDHCRQSARPVTVWSGLVAARLITARAVGEGLKEGPCQH